MKKTSFALIGLLSLLFLSPPTREAAADVATYRPDVSTTDGFVRARALSKIGRALGGGKNSAWYWDDFFGNVNNVGLATNWAFTPTGTGNLALQLNDESGGVQQTTSGATANSRALNQTVSPAIRAAGTGVWYCAHRSKITTAVDAQAKAHAGLLNAGGASTLVSGFLGNLSAVNFVFQWDGGEAGTFANSGVAVDTAYHVFEMWSVGDNKIHCAIDFGSTDICAGATMAAAPTDSLFGVRITGNGTTAATRSVRDDWFAIMSKRN